MREVYTAIFDVSHVSNGEYRFPFPDGATAILRLTSTALPDLFRILPEHQHGCGAAGAHNHSLHVQNDEGEDYLEIDSGGGHWSPKLISGVDHHQHEIGPAGVGSALLPDSEYVRAMEVYLNGSNITQDVIGRTPALPGGSPLSGAFTTLGIQFGLHTQAKPTKGWNLLKFVPQGSSVGRLTLILHVLTSVTADDTALLVDAAM